MYEFSMLTHGGLCLRAIEEKDLDLVRHLRNDPTTWVNLTDVVFIDQESQKKWFATLAGRQDRKYFVIGDEAGKFLGLVRMDEIDQVNRSIRVGCDIVPDMRGKGVGSRAYDAILKYCFDLQNMHRVWLAVLDYNDVAQKLYLKKGFETEGRYREAIFRDGRYHDYVIMSLLEQHYRERTSQGRKLS